MVVCCRQGVWLLRSEDCDVFCILGPLHCCTALACISWHHVMDAEWYTPGKHSSNDIIVLSTSK